MADMEITTRLLYEALGTNAIDQASKALEANKQRIERVQAALGSFGQTTRAQEQLLQRLADRHVDLTERMRVLQDQARRGGSALESLERGSGKAGMAMLQMGYFADDLQYGIKGVVNNIPGLVASLGGGAGVAGVVGIAAVAVSQLANHWEQLSALISLPAFEQGAAAMDALGKSTHRTGEETDQLNKYLREQAEVKSLLGMLPEPEQKAKKAREEAISEAGGIDKLAKGLAESRIAAQGGVGALQERAEAGRGTWDWLKASISLGTNRAIGNVAATLSGDVSGRPGMAQARALALRWSQEEQGKIRQQAVEQAQAEISAAALDPQQYAKLLGQLPPEAAAKLKEATPEALAAKNQAKTDAKTAADLLKSEQTTARGMMSKGALAKDNPLLQSFLAGEVGIGDLGAMGGTIQGATLQSLRGREATARQAGLDPKAIGELQAQTTLLGKLVGGQQRGLNQPMAPPKPHAVPGRAVGRNN